MGAKEGLAFWVLNLCSQGHMCTEEIYGKKVLVEQRSDLNEDK